MERAFNHRASGNSLDQVAFVVPEPTPDQVEGWSVGDLARSAGVSVRTLHHYDHIGLLVPADRSTAGHRRYSRSDVQRLYRILVLRSLGFDLPSIGQMLAGDSTPSLLETARWQLDNVSERIRATQALHAKLATLVTALEASQEPSTADLLHAMEATTMSVRLTENSLRTGSTDEASLGDRSRVSKTHPIIAAVGAVDELNSHIGLALGAGSISEPYAAWLAQVQNELFDVGADVCVPQSTADDKLRIRLTADYAERLERWCDEASEVLEPLDSFVVPGGPPAAGFLHVARTVCQRAERSVLAVEQVNPNVPLYLSRLSDLLFMLARIVAPNRPLWQPAITQVKAA